MQALRRFYETEEEREGDSERASKRARERKPKVKKMREE